MNQHEDPNPVLDPFLPALSAWAIITAASEGVFDALSNAEHSVAEIALELGLEPAGVDRLMSVLAHLGYVEPDEGKFRLSDVSRNCLTAGSPHRLINWVRFCKTQLLAMSHLQSTLSGGKHVDLYDLMSTPGEIRVQQMAMAETAAPVAEWVSQHIPILPGGTKMLDIGGSHGLYSAAICRRNPPLRGEVMELPQILDIARSVAAELGTDAVVTHIEGNILSADLESGYAAVFAGNLIHHLPPEDLAKVFEKTWHCLRPGGTIAIWDIEEGLESDDLVSCLFSLFFYLTSAGGCHPRSRIRATLHDAGFRQFRTFRPDRPSLHTLFVAQKPE